MYFFVCVGCATIDERQVVQTLPPSPNPQAQSPKLSEGVGHEGTPVRVLKRKVAIARFTNETKY